MEKIPMNYIGLNKRLRSEQYRQQLLDSSVSKDYITDPSVKTQLLIQLQVSITNDVLAPVLLGASSWSSLKVTDRCLTDPIQVEFMVDLVPSPNNGDHNVNHHIDALVSKRYLSKRVSETVKKTISECVIPGFAEFALMEIRPKWVKVSLAVEVERVYLAEEKDGYGTYQEHEDAYVLDLVTVEALQVKRFNRIEDLELATGGSIGSCRVCSGEFSLGRDIIAKMPCSHVFHEGCILQWLTGRNTCPLCAYEMPTARTETKVPTA